MDVGTGFRDTTQKEKDGLSIYKTRKKDGEWDEKITVNLTNVSINLGKCLGIFCSIENQKGVFSSVKALTP